MDSINCIAKAEWVKLPLNSKICFAGPSYICIKKESHLLVHSLTTGVQRVYSALGRNTGDGIRCFTGHRQRAIFAFAEYCFSPRIFIVGAVEFDRLNTIPATGIEENYVALEFSNYDFMISLSDLPHWTITVWNWRTGLKLVSTETQSKSDLIEISCSQELSISVAEVHAPPMPELLVWDVHYCFNRCVLIKHAVHLPEDNYATRVVWNKENLLFVMDSKGRIYKVKPNYTVEMVIGESCVGQYKPFFTWYKNGLFVMDCNMAGKHYIFKGGMFSNDWNIQTKELLQLICCNTTANDIVLGISTSGVLMELDFRNKSFIKKNYSCNNFRDIHFIYPTNDYFATLSNEGEIHIWTVKTGEKIQIYETINKVSSLCTNPVFPYLALGLVIGELHLVAFIQHSGLKFLTKFKLTDDAITNIIFNQDGTIIVASNLEISHFFIMKGKPGEQINILCDIYYGRPVIQACISDTNKHYLLYLLVVASNNKTAGRKIVLKLISKSTLAVEKRKYSSNTYFSQLLVTTDAIISREISSRNISHLLLKKRKIFTENYRNGHFMRHCVLGSTQDYLYTFGQDGLVNLYERDFTKIIALCQSHHRTDGGIYKTIVDCLGRFALSLGYNGTVVCTQLKVSDKVSERFARENEKKLFQFELMFNKETIGFLPEGKHKGKNYLQMQEALQYEKESEDYAEVREELMREFLNLKETVVKLLEANITGPESERVDLLEFYLHEKLKNYKEKITAKKCEDIVLNTHVRIKAQEKVRKWMKENCWDTMKVKRGIIYGIFSNFYVENYTSYPADLIRNFKFQRVQLHRELEEMFLNKNHFKPWMNMSEKELEKQLAQNFPLIVTGELQRFMELLKTAESRKDSDRESVLGRLLDFPTSKADDGFHTWELAYNEEEIHTYEQLHATKVVLHISSKELREYFNSHYVQTLEMKKREVNTVKEKNDRLRYILSEMNQSSEINDPVWVTDEVPESLIEVTDDEIGILPYISPSQQRLLDEKAAEEERIRLLLLADDFRERALERMMYGVLEIRWEDTLKKDIPKPACMLEKLPEEFNAEDLKAVSEYEKQVEILNLERQRYRTILQYEYEHVSQDIRTIIHRFNKNLLELLHLKIKVEIARLQEALCFRRMQYQVRSRIMYNTKEENTKEILGKNKRDMDIVRAKLIEVQESTSNIKTVLDQLIAKDKQLEKDFKHDLQDCNSVIQEQALKYYRKNPKAQLRTVKSSSTIYDLAACCVSPDAPKTLLMAECLDYLHSIDILDNYNNLVSNVDETVYKTVCMHRRRRLENELKKKAVNIEQANVELSISNLQKSLNQCKEYENELNTELKEIRIEKLKSLHNKQLQIVMRHGAVEIPFKGMLSDLSDAMLVRRKEIEAINSAILKAGRNKLHAMQNKMEHRKSIMMKEWEHKQMKMRIEDLENDLYIIESAKLTKDVQVCLSKLTQGSKTVSTVDPEIESTKESYERQITRTLEDIGSLKRRINIFMAKNAELDRQIVERHYDVCELALNVNPELGAYYKEEMDMRNAAVVRRDSLVKEVQDQRNEILILQSELQLRRLKTYPTLKFKTLS